MRKFSSEAWNLTLKQCNSDVILVVNHGEIVEQGTHGELMEREGFYYQLYRAQFE